MTSTTAQNNYNYPDRGTPPQYMTSQNPPLKPSQLSVLAESRQPVSRGILENNGQIGNGLSNQVKVMIPRAQAHSLMYSQSVPGNNGFNTNFDNSRGQIVNNDNLMSRAISLTQASRSIIQQASPMRSNGQLPRLVPPVELMINGSRLNFREYFKNRVGILLGFTAAFGELDTDRYLADLVRQSSRLQNAVDFIGAVAVNDAVTMRAWGKANKVSYAITMIADAGGELTAALNQTVPAEDSSVGFRSKRYAILIYPGCSLELIGLDASATASQVLKILPTKTRSPWKSLLVMPKAVQYKQGSYPGVSCANTLQRLRLDVMKEAGFFVMPEWQLQLREKLCRKDEIAPEEAGDNHVFAPTTKNFRAAIHWLLEKAQPGDALMAVICGTSMEDHQSTFGERVLCTDDAEEIMKQNNSDHFSPIDEDGDSSESCNESGSPREDTAKMSLLSETELYERIASSVKENVRLTLIADAEGFGLPLPYVSEWVPAPSMPQGLARQGFNSAFGACFPDAQIKGELFSIVVVPMPQALDQPHIFQPTGKLIAAVRDLSVQLNKSPLDLSYGDALILLNQMVVHHQLAVKFASSIPLDLTAPFSLTSKLPRKDYRPSN